MPNSPRRGAGILAAVAAAVATTAGVPPVSAAPPVAQVHVVVQSTGDREAATTAVSAVGGTVTVELPIVDGVAARVPAHAVGELAAAPGILAVTENSAVTTTGTGSDGTSSSTAKQAFVQSTGAAKLHSRGILGTHRPGTPTRVALIDTGVDTDVATTGDLAGRVVPVQDPTDPSPDAPTVPCVDFSGERSCDDDFGHGTFMAGLIAGDGAASGGRLSGTAPAAEIVSVKIAGRTGASDVTKVLAAVQWVVSFRERYDIGVLNLSLGTNSRTDPRIDPLNRAVQRAWDSGIVVVAAAGNNGRPEGDQPWTINKPADDPLVLTVGAVDDRKTPGTSDDSTPAFTSRGGPRLAKPDIVAPGAHVVSLRAVGSTLDGVGTKLDGTYRRGSGTSMSAAVVSGAAALLREARPTWTPDQVKHALKTTARKVALDDPYAIGTGLPDVYAATSADLTGAAQPRAMHSDLGALDDSRAGLVVLGTQCDPGSLLSLVQEPTCVLAPLLGEVTSQGLAFDGHDWTGHDWTEATWYASQWTGHDWTGHDWTGHDWTGHDWTGHDWTGHDWTGHDWTGSEWTSSDGSTASDTESYGSDDPADDSLVRGSLLYGSAS